MNKVDPIFPFTEWQEALKTSPCLYCYRFYHHSIGIRVCLPPAILASTWPNWAVCCIRIYKHQGREMVSKEVWTQEEKRWVSSFKYLKRLRTEVTEVEETWPAIKAVLMFPYLAFLYTVLEHALIGTLGNLTIIGSIFL